MTTAAPNLYATRSEGTPGAAGAARFRSAESDRSCLTVEFFGPAGAGKTTVATALWAALRARGTPAQLVLDGHVVAASAHRRQRGALPLSAQLAKFAGGVRALFPDERVDPFVGQLLAILPPGDRIREMRIRRYAADLCQTWRENRRPGEVLILDQGFVTLLCSLALLAEPVDRSALSRGLAMVPPSDLLIHVEAARPTIEDRLQERVQRRRGFERLLGNKVSRWLRQAELASTLDGLIAERDGAVLRVRSENRADVDAAVETVMAEIGSRRGGLSA